MLLKYSATRIVPPPAGASIATRLLLRFPPTFLLGLCLFALNVFAYQAALRSLKLSMAYPVMVGGGFLLILVASAFLFQERLGAAQYAGIALILGGIWLVVR